MPHTSLFFVLSQFTRLSSSNCMTSSIARTGRPKPRSAEARQHFTMTRSVDGNGNGADKNVRISNVKNPVVSTVTDLSADAAQIGFGRPVTVEEVLESLHHDEDPVWKLVRSEAQSAADNEPQLASSLYASILVHSSLEDAVATVLGIALDTTTFQATQWVQLFREALSDDSGYRKAIRTDIAAFMERDPATAHAVRVVLHAKGFQALESWRLAHWLWQNNRTNLALYLQSMISTRFAVDIHPAAIIGTGVLIDHGTGIVIGETATIGNDVSILHNVTLGGTGKETGDRHPKVGSGVMIGAGATVLGNIQIGTGAHIAACSVVLKPVEPFSVVSGVPAKVVGKVSYKAGVMPSFVMDQRLSLEVVGAENPYHNVVTGPVRGSKEHNEEDETYVGDSI